MTLGDFGVELRDRVLSNGAHFTHFYRPGMPLHLRASFLSGSRFDPRELQGLAHYTEHLLFASTEKYPSKEKFINFIAENGGHYNASTGPDKLKMFVSLGDYNDVGIATEILSQGLMHSLFAEAEIETERGVILDELRRSVSTPSRMLSILWRRLLFQGTDYASEFSNLGSEGSIKAIKPTDLVRYRDSMLTSGRARIWASGGSDTDELCAAIERDLALPESQKVSVKVANPTRKSHVMVERMEESEQIYFSVGFQSVPEGDKDEHALALIRSILGGGSTGSLYRRLRIEKGLVYAVSASQLSFASAGNFTIDTSTGRENLRQAMEIIFDEIRRTFEGGLTQGELDLAKKKYQKSTRLRMQTSESWVGYHDGSRSILDPTFTTIVDDLERIDAVTLEDLAIVGKKYFAPGSWLVAACGNLGAEDVHVDY